MRKMIPLAVPNLCGNEKRYLNDCIETTFVSSVGEYVNRIEKMTAELCEAKYAVATSSGTTGLHTALLSVGVNREDLVIIPNFTFIATANAVSHCGALPWIIDIVSSDWTMDASILIDALKKDTEIVDGKTIHKATGRRVAAIMPVYTLGNIPDMDAIMEVASKYTIPVVADAACALGALYKGKRIGVVADLSVISLNGNKTVTSGGGGIIIGNNNDYLALSKHVSTTARASSEYDFDMVGYNYRMTNIQAAVGCAQLENLAKFVKRKKEIRAFYNNAFTGINGVDIFRQSDYCDSSCWFSGIVIKNGNLDLIRNICMKLKENKIEARSFWKPISIQKPYINAVLYGDLSNSLAIWDKILTLPCSTGITDEELHYVSDTVLRILEAI